MLRSLSAFGLVWLLGCSNSPPPLATVPALETKTPEWKAPAKPKESDAAAKKLLGEVLSAHTLGQPQKLDKLTSVSFERTGTGRTPEGDYGPLSWQGKLIGTRKYHVVFKFLEPGGKQWAQVFDNGKAAMGPIGGPMTRIPQEFVRDITLQIGEESCLYLFGLNDPALIAQTASVAKLHNKEMLGLHIWSPTIEHMLLHVDAATKLITRVQYMGSEAGTPLFKDIVITSHREIAGLKLPEAYSVTINGVAMLDWDKLTFDFGGAIDPKLFELP